MGQFIEGDVPEFIPNAGKCIATKNAVGGPERVQQAERLAPNNPMDSGWVFYSPFDSPDYIADSSNFVIADFNELVALNPALMGIYDYPVGTRIEINVREDGSRVLRNADTGEVAPPFWELDRADEQPAAEEPATPQAEAALQASPQLQSLFAAGAKEWRSLPLEQIEGRAGAFMAAQRAFAEEPAARQRMALFSEFFGTAFVVPVLDGIPVTFSAGDGRQILGVTLNEASARSLLDRLGLGDARLEVWLGEELLQQGFDVLGAASIVVDPQGLGVEFGQGDPYLGTLMHVGELKFAQRQGGKQGVLDYLSSPGSRGLYMYKPEAGEKALPLLLSQPKTGDRVFALFSSALEAFRFSDTVGTAEVSGEWLATSLEPDMWLVLDPAALQHGSVEFMPDELAAAGLRRS